MTQPGSQLFGTRALRRAALVSGLAIAIAGSSGCGGEEPPASVAEDHASSGGDDAAAHSDNPIDKAHRDFQESVRPVAEKVDEKTQEVVDEGKRAVEKVADAVSE